MEVWLDTTDLQAIRYAAQLQILTGVTTNPSLLAKNSNVLEETLQQILYSQSGLLAVQVVADDAQSMIVQGKRLAQLSDRIVIKIPVIPEGMKAIVELQKNRIATMATAIYDPSQLLLSAKMKAQYAAVYLSKMEQEFGNSQESLQKMMQMIDCQKYSLKLLAASIRKVEQIINCACLGVHAITMPKEIFYSWMSAHPATEKNLRIFKETWQGNKSAMTRALFQSTGFINSVEDT
jgi:transaldolase